MAFSVLLNGISCFFIENMRNFFADTLFNEHHEP